MSFTLDDALPELYIPVTTTASSAVLLPGTLTATKKGQQKTPWLAKGLVRSVL